MGDVNSVYPGITIYVNLLFLLCLTALGQNVWEIKNHMILNK